MELLNGKIKPIYFKYLSASFGTALIASVYSIVDVAMVGQYQGPEGTAALTGVTQPEILRRIDAALDEARRGGADLAFVDGAVIVGTPFEARCDALILVTAPYETSVARICARDGIAPEMARRRLDAQTPLETLRAAATAELVNDSTPDALREKLRSVLNGLEKEGTCQKPKSEKEAF